MEYNMKRLILVILIFALFLSFIVFNLDNRCDISFGFKTFKEIPIFLSAIFSFTLGMLFAVPLIFSLSRGRKKTSVKGSSGLPYLGNNKGANKKRWGKKGGEDNRDSAGKAHGEPSASDEYSKENSPYGID